MQAPSTHRGLKNMLKNLGCGSVIPSIDFNSPSAKDHLKQEIEHLYSSSNKTGQDEDRRRQAISLVERFPWDSGAQAGLSALIEDDQALVPMKVEYGEEDEDGEVQEIEVAEASVNGLRAFARGLLDND